MITETEGDGMKSAFYLVRRRRMLKLSGGPHIGSRDIRPAECNCRSFYGYRFLRSRVILRLIQSAYTYGWPCNCPSGRIVFGRSVCLANLLRSVDLSNPLGTSQCSHTEVSFNTGKRPPVLGCACHIPILRKNCVCKCRGKPISAHLYFFARKIYTCHNL